MSGSRWVITPSWLSGPWRSFLYSSSGIQDLPGGSDSKASAYNAGAQVQSLGQEDPLEKEMQPTPVFLPGKSHGWRSLAGYSPWGCKESDTTEKIQFLSVYSCHLFLISSASVRPVAFLSFIVPIFVWNVPLVSLLAEIPSLSHSVVFLYFFALIAEEGFLISPYYSLKLCIQMDISFLFSFAFSFSSFLSYM